MLSSRRSIVGGCKNRLTGQITANYLAPMACLLVAVILMEANVWAQQPGVNDSDKQTIELLVRRIDQLEARVAQLESGKSTASSATAEPAPTPPAESPQA